ncbi:MAG: carboxylating nicotinate-nucleotide diphosphorylase [Thermofilaceae archaeon]|nr:carboxylating nicotinate-nucleotide diphosphorylase [Thermofilaceae archaeon]MCX8181370.1 carboxylating nicotinate-nucleotide diphosphorylase [Thermofilaceae archaeon]MDW8004670.1 carboxylating nicotinate-nucleotide diphosphorylase [Thermofilaceae archaeon]
MVEELIYKKMLDWLAEDIPFWDVTAALLPQGCKCRAIIVAKERGVAACVEDVEGFLKWLGFNVRVKVSSKTVFKEGDTLMEIEGDMRKLLQVERLVLNVLSHSCGVATETRKAVEKVKVVNPKVRVSATRKTLPGLRYFEKKAVEAGGGDPHRLSLSDMVLIKDNHLRYFRSVKSAVEAAKGSTSFTMKIEVEVSSPEEALEAAEAGADIVMLDNFSVEDVKRTIELLEKAGLRDKVVVEVSGGVTLENIGGYAEAGPDVISMGWLTHSAKAVDMSLEIVEVVKP